MKRMRILGLALVAVFAFAALSAGAASANPTWKVCEKAPKVGKTYTGKYLDKACTEPASKAQEEEGKKNKYNLVEGIGKGKGFKGKGGKAVLHNVIPGKGDIKVECGSFKDSGSVVAPSGVAKVSAEFKKCKSLGSPYNEGGKKETIKTNLMTGNLGWLSKPTVAGESLTSEAAPHTGYLAEFECEGLAKVRVFGAVIGTIEPVGEVTNKSTSTFAVGEYLGEPEPGYKPLTNPPAFEEEAVGVLLTELNGPETGNTWQPPGGLPSGQEAEAANKGEKLGIS